MTITYTVDPYNGKKLAEASNGTDLQTNEAGTPVDKKGVPLMLNEDGTWSQQSNGDNALTAFRFQTSVKNSLCISQFHCTMSKQMEFNPILTTIRIPARKIEISKNEQGVKVGILMGKKGRTEIPLNEHDTPLDKIGVPMVLLAGCTDIWVSTTSKEEREYLYLNALMPPVSGPLAHSI